MSPDSARMPALMVPELGRVELTETEVPRPAEGQILAEALYTGVSVGTELAGAAGKNKIWGPPPFVAGYQGVGRIVEFGGDETGGLRVGDTVAYFSHGTHSAFAVARLERTLGIDEYGDLANAALFVAPSVGTNALNKAGIRAGDTVLVVGQGLIGQTTAMLAGMRGAYVVVSDVSPERLAVSRAHCADRVVDASLGAPWEQLREDFPQGFDVVIESTGITQLVDQALACTRFEGKIVFEGQYPGDLRFEYELAHQKQLDAYFPWFIGTPASRAAVLRQLSSGTLDMRPLVSHFVNWRESAEVYERLFTEERDHLNGIVFDWRDSTKG